MDLKAEKLRLSPLDTKFYKKKLLGMCIFITMLLFSSLLSSCQEEKIDAKTMISLLSEHNEKIEKIAYEVERIDTFAQDVPPVRSTGYALIERNQSDTIFGFSFYGKKHNLQSETIYDKEIGFEISLADSSYVKEPGHTGFLGRDGGQMILKEIFQLDSVYKSIELIEKEDRYLLKYNFEDDKAMNVSKINKTIVVDKKRFLPIEVSRTYTFLGKKAVHELYLNNVKINDQIKNSINKYKTKLKDFEEIKPIAHVPNSILNKKVIPIKGVNLLDERQMIDLKINKPILIDFWEVWCGWCIKSFPEIERLNKTYHEDLQVIGVLTENKEKAKKLINLQEVSFLNVYANKDLLNQYDVRSFPRYFLINKEGIVKYEYFGFSDQIEKDIIKIIGK